LRRHGRRKKLQYLLKWRGYSQAHDSWEPADQVHAPELVDRFHRENPKAIRAICLKEGEIDDFKAMPDPYLDGPNVRTSPVACWSSPVWDNTPAPPMWGLLIPSSTTASWDIAPTFQYQTLFGNLVTTHNLTTKDFK
jgi:hypothetical protein